jgi:predicted acylesterase/phospholipase RssA
VQEEDFAKKDRLDMLRRKGSTINRRAFVTGELERKPFRLLSLSGGGVRGIFQARYLERLEEKLNKPIRDHFAAIAATSTGAIVGLTVAAGKPASQITRLYRDHAESIFSSRRFAAVRRGPRYDVGRLEHLLVEELGNLTMDTLPLPVFITSSVVDTYEGRVFTNEDAKERLVDVALASAGAPTFFPPRRLHNDNRWYVDGGLWANDPAYVGLHALLHGSDNLVAPDVSVLSVGTGRVQHGMTYQQLIEMRPASLPTLRFIFDIVPSLQAWQQQQLLERVLQPDQVVTINPQLPRWIPLDDAHGAIERLPALADSEFDKSWYQLRRLFDREVIRDEFAETLKNVSPTAVAGVAAANLKTFIPARKYYAIYRGGRESITEYIAQAHDELFVVSVNLMTGHAIESILGTFLKMLSRPDAPVRITLSLLDPEETSLMHAVAGNLDMQGEELASSINRLIGKIGDFHTGLSDQTRDRFRLHCHKTLPSASAIMIDPHDENGVIQLETKAYKTPTMQAFGFEVGYGSELFMSLRQAYTQLIADGRRIY